MSDESNAMLLTKGKYKIQAVARAIKRLQDHKSFEEKEDAWQTIIYNLAQIGKILDKFKHEIKTKKIADAFINEQKNDPMLVFLYQARNDEDHGMKPYVTQRQQGEIALVGKGKGTHFHRASFGTTHFENVSIGPGVEIRIPSESPESMPITAEISGDSSILRDMTVTPHGIVLIPIVNYKVNYPVPTIHLGITIVPDPVNVAELAHAYYERKLGEIEAALRPSSNS